MPRKLLSLQGSDSDSEDEEPEACRRQCMSAGTVMSPLQDSEAAEEYDFDFFYGSDTPPEAQKRAVDSRKV